MGCPTFTKFVDERSTFHFAKLGFVPGDRAFCGKWSRRDRAVDECNGGFIDQSSHSCRKCSGIANESRGRRGGEW